VFGSAQGYIGVLIGSRRAYHTCYLSAMLHMVVLHLLCMVCTSYLQRNLGLFGVQCMECLVQLMPFGAP
jgi:hypothetical protein